MTTSSGPGFSLKQEGISYLCSGDIPAVIADVMRIGSGLGDIFQGQGDYWQLTRGGGHGDYHTIVLAPSSVQENADLAYISFDLAENTAILFSWHQMRRLDRWWNQLNSQL